MDTVSIKAYGKVNLGLDVTGRRDDGYHLVRMIMQTVNVYDEITVSANADGPYRIRLTCSAPGVPLDETNLAWKAARAVCETYNIRAEVLIHIDKQIPVAAGMAGGSADAAGVILAMDRLFGLSMSEAAMDTLALSLGADVPFCLRRGTYLAEGIGEKLTRIEDLAHCYMVIVKPSFSVSTPWAYRALDAYLERMLDAPHPDIDKLKAAIGTRDIRAICPYMDNILEPMVVKEHPEIQKIKDRLVESGAVKALMSGSGPTVFGIFADEEHADQAVLNLGGGEYGKFKVEF